MRWIWFVMMICLAAGGARSQPLVGPWPATDPTEVVVLATPHLSGIDHLRLEWMSELVDRLASWQPEVIAIEGLSGPECHLLRLYEKSWPGSADSYCATAERLVALAARATGLAMPAAEAEAEQAVARLTSDSPPEERRRMAALFAAAGNPGSAAVQWLRLAPTERRPSGIVSLELAGALDQLSIRKNENYWIAAALAARLGLERLYPTDDHLSDRLQAEAPPGLEQAMREIWSGPRPAMFEQMVTMESELKDPGSVLRFYRFLNRPDVGEAFVRSDMGKAFATASASNHGRRYVAWWEARNLRMVANVRQALGRRPGARGLVIVGSTHKPYFDAYLGLMHEIRLVPTEQVLSGD